MSTPLLSTQALSTHLADPAWAVIDCRFDLAKPGWGEAEYRAAHIPGAVYAHLDRDLSGLLTGRNGRHPLPDVETFKARLGRWGVGPGVQVAVYDQSDGMFASRLWWMLRALGHESVAVLEGGWIKWQAEGRPQRAGDEARPSVVFTGAERLAGTVTPDEAGRLAQDPDTRLLDARAPERYRGETEPIDPVAGHIPGAVNLPYTENLGADGRFKSFEALRALYGSLDPARLVVHCGSGVTACHTLLAMDQAGLPGGALFVGSWGEWCRTSRPVAAGDQP